MNNFTSSIAAILVVLFTTGLAQAQETGGESETVSIINDARINPSLSDRVQFRAGPFFAKWDSTVNIDGQDFDLDDRLSDSDTVLAINGFARITKRLRINFGYWASSREDMTILSEPTPVGPITLPPGTQFDSEYETSTLRGGLGWAFVSNDRAEVGIDAGLSIVSIKSNLTGRFSGTPPLDLVSVDDTEPMATIGLFFQYALSPRWTIAGRVGALGFDIGDIEGQIYGGEARLEYRPLKNVGLGVAYNYDDADVTLKDDPTQRNFTYTTQGAFAYLLFGFGSIR